MAGSYGDNKQICRVQVEKVASSSGFSGWAVPYAILYSIQRGARVISLSMSGMTHSNSDFQLWEDTFYYVNDYWDNVVILCGTGNTWDLEGGRDEPKPWITYPAAWSCDLDCVIAVGSSTHEDLHWLHSEWRQAWWEGHDYHGEVSFLAPGGDSNQEYSYWTTERADNGEPDWSQRGGATSGATAFAAGIAGMLISKSPGLKNYQIKNILQNSAYRIAEPEGCSWGSYEDCWDHQCWCDRPGSGRIDALYCLSPWIWIRCPRGAERSPVPDQVEPAFPGDEGMSAEVSVYDLLGRRLYSFRVGQDRRSRESINSYIKSRGALAVGAKIVRFRTENEVRTWRLAP